MILTFVIVAVGILAVIIIVLVVLLRDSSSPSIFMWHEIDGAIPTLLRRAAEQRDQPTGIDVGGLPGQSAQLQGIIQFAYTIDETAEGMVHIVSSQLLKPRPEKYQVQCMLVALAVLNKQLQQARIDPASIAFEITKPDARTHFLTMRLTPAQHAAMLRTATPGTPSSPHRPGP